GRIAASALECDPMRSLAPVVFLIFALAVGAAAKPKPFSVVEATIPDLQAALRAGRVTSRELVGLYLARIATYEDKLNAAITVNPKALDEADALDREPARETPRRPPPGPPLALKDNPHPTDLPPPGGALPFAGLVPPYEAPPTKTPRAAGAIIPPNPKIPEPPTGAAATPPM